jgi:peptidylprolyl isomerase
MIKTLLLIALLSINSCAKKNDIAVLETTSGTIEIELRADIAPKAVENFKKLIKKGYYNNIIFHRIIKNFMIQGGDPTGTGRGGKSIWGKPFEDEFKKNVVFDKAGILAMANSGKNTNGSQFFITTVPTPWLNHRHTIFGYVKQSSMNNVYKLGNVATQRSKPIKIEKIIKAYIK